jgi:hypothetical protein
MSEHVSTNEKATTNQLAKDDVTTIKHLTRKWLRSIGEKTAHWQGDKRNNDFMDGYFACHKLRAPLTDGIQPKVAFLDQFTPQLLASPNYHVDGQIKEEVYVYGSFLQSKMFAEVNCLDYHDKNTMKVKPTFRIFLGFQLFFFRSSLANPQTHLVLLVKLFSPNVRIAKPAGSTAPHTPD